MGQYEIIDQIKKNEIVELHLSKVPEDYFGEYKDFVDAMGQNTSIKKVIFDHDFLSCSVGKERAAIVSAVGSLPSVESVVLKDSLLMVGICVTNMVKNAKTLQDLSIDHCLLQGVPDDFELLKGALNESPAVKSLHISDCTAPNDTVDLKQVMESLKEGLSVDVSGAGSA